MVEVYRRVAKDAKHLYGVEQIEMTDRPFIISLAAHNTIPSVCGIPKCAMRAARVYTDDEAAAMLRIEDMPIDFLGVRFPRSGLEQEFVDQFLFPYLASEGYDYESIMGEAAKVNFMTYYNGINTYRKIEELLVKKLHSLSFTDEQISGIASNITLIAVTTNISVDDLQCTSIKIKDVNDGEVFESKELAMLSDDDNYNYSVSPNNPNSALYVYRGNGEHSVRAHLDNDSIAKPVFCGLMVAVIKKALQGETLTSDEILDLLGKFAKNDVAESHRLMTEIDGIVGYDGVRRLDRDSAELRKQLDDTVRDLASREDSLMSARRRIQLLSDEIDKLHKSVRTYCSPVTQAKIAIDLGEQYSEEDIKRITELPSDAELLTGMKKGEDQRQR